jgi:putative thiamine transport system substrate-binding protein
MKLSRRDLVKAAGAAALLPLLPKAGHAADWAALEAQAKGQTVYFNAWAGSEPINAYIGWAAEQVKARYGVTLEHM